GARAGGGAGRGGGAVGARRRGGEGGGGAGPVSGDAPGEGFHRHVARVMLASTFLRLQGLPQESTPVPAAGTAFPRHATPVVPRPTRRCSCGASRTASWGGGQPNQAPRSVLGEPNRGVLARLPVVGEPCLLVLLALNDLPLTPTQPGLHRRTARAGVQPV